MIARSAGMLLALIAVLGSTMIGAEAKGTVAGCRAAPTRSELRLVPAVGPGGPPDFLNLFRSNAPWKTAEARVGVFGLSVYTLFRSSPKDLRLLLGFLSEHDIAVSVQTSPLSPPRMIPGLCGYGVEGYSDPGEPLGIADKLRAFGVAPTYFDFDEPLFYGHSYSGPHACHSDVAELARDAGKKAREVLTVFPKAQFVEAEPIMSFPEATWRSIISTWLTEFQRSAGKPIKTLFVDMAWQLPWQARLLQLRELLHRHGTGLGVIYNGDDTAKSNQDWIRGSIAHFKRVQSVLKGAPDAVSLQSWVGYPTRLLPDTDPLSMTGLVNTYWTWSHARHRCP